MHQPTKLILLGITLLGTTVLGVAGLHYTRHHHVQPTFTTDVVKRGNIEKVVLTNGVIYPSKLVSIGAQVSGLIEHIPVALGDKIQQGDLIAQIDNLTQQNALKEAQASLKSLNAQYRAKQAQISSASAALQRKTKMLADGATSQSEYDAAQLSLAVYQAELEQLSAQQEQALISVNNAELDLGYTQIGAPIEGTVIYISVDEGQTVNASQDTPSIAEIAQLDVMTIKAQVSEADIMQVKVGQSAYFTTLGGSSQTFHGTLKAIEPGPTLLDGNDSDLTISDSEAIYYNALFDVENPGHQLRIGMTAQVSIVLQQAKATLLVPSQVLIKKPGRKMAYQVPVRSGDTIEYRDVEVGINNKIQAQIVSGLVQGDEVIIGRATGHGRSKNGPSSPGDFATNGLAMPGSQQNMPRPPRR